MTDCEEALCTLSTSSVDLLTNFWHLSSHSTGLGDSRQRHHVFSEGLITFSYSSAILFNLALVRQPFVKLTGRSDMFYLKCWRYRKRLHCSSFIISFTEILVMRAKTHWPMFRKWDICFWSVAVIVPLSADTRIYFTLQKIILCTNFSGLHGTCAKCICCLLKVNVILTRIHWNIYVRIFFSFRSICNLLSSCESHCAIHVFICKIKT